MYCIQLFRQTYKNIKPIKIFSAIQLKKVKKTRFETIRIELLPTPSSSLVFFPHIFNILSIFINREQKVLGSLWLTKSNFWP